MKGLLITAATMLLPAFAFAQETDSPTPLAMTAAQGEQCVTMMSGFPNDGPDSRYVFFRLSQVLAEDITPELSQLMADYLAENDVARLPADTQMFDVIETIADPVIRQAAPEQTVAAMAHIAYFNALCGRFTQGQIDSLLAFQPELADADIAVREDALYLRQILVEALDRLGAGDQDVVDAYTTALVEERDDIEYVGFEDEIGDLEAMFMGDLDQRLSRSNDAVNEGVNTETIDDAAALARDMNEQARKNAERERIYTLIRILGNVG